MVITKECGLESKKERKNKEKCINGAMFLTYGVLARDMELVKLRLETTQENNILLASRLSAFQVRILEIEDALMDDANAEGEPLDLSSDHDLVENIIAILVPGPSMVHTLVPVEVPSKYIPPSLHVTPSPPYVASYGDNLEHSGVPEYWVDSDVIADSEVNQWFCLIVPFSLL
jgi:hypothetical protein